MHVTRYAWARQTGSRGVMLSGLTWDSDDRGYDLNLENMSKELGSLCTCLTFLPPHCTLICTKVKLVWYVGSHAHQLNGAQNKEILWS